VLQDPTPVVTAHRSSLPAGQCRCPEPLIRLPATPSFGYAPPPPALPNVTPKSRLSSQGAPRRRLAAVGPSANTPPHVTGCHASRAVTRGRLPAAGDLIIFSIVLNFKHCFKLQKFLETCRNVQNLENKFCMNPLEPLLTVGLTKLTFTR
jgi:hypothetical protein